ncbi:hypothetical protein Back2_14540 [Nocardioides baekrokdamisoli]|uniref:DUF559 domain-containing protein n=1 Tax=Nocardioides baekrokdamisoli TaxID=1804624 RepID=A0A3G9IDY0_9ACTN|nr:hypothetical protein [Nocardioides baekrokdamisoli]BBH17167.1 hypothetical protein Back2_14540 [Nocardioides baekrokdamisoli]
MDMELRARMASLAPSLPRGGMFTGLAACAAYELWLPPTPTESPLSVSVPSTVRGSRRAELGVVRIAHPPAPWTWAGIPVAPVEEAILVAASDLGMLDTVVLIDSALRAKAVTPEVLTNVAQQRRRGAPALRKALAKADARSESPWETLLRLFHRSINVPVEPQVRLHAPDGRFIARADLLISGTRTLQEYDGADHREPDQYREDRRRDADLAAHGFIRHGWTAPDVTRDFARVMASADRALGRRSEDSRLDTWRAELGQSWFGRRKVVQKRAS